MKLRTLFFFSVALCCFSSCGSKEGEVVTHVHDATIKANVYHEVVKPSGDFDNVPIKDATIDLYKTDYDRQNNQDKVISGYTDSSGLVIFSGLKEDYYYIRASHPTYGIKLEEVSTPDGSVAFVDIVY